MRVNRGVDTMTLDQIDAAIDNYTSKPPGQLTPSDADRIRELRLAKRRITECDNEYSWWR